MTARKKPARVPFDPDTDDKPFPVRWNLLIRSLLVDSSVKHVARAAMDYANFYDGSSCRPSQERLARETGYSRTTVAHAWSAMQGMGLAELVDYSVSYQGRADEYQLQIPDHWRNLPILGPHGGKFTCVNCKRPFNPQGNCTVTKEDWMTYKVTYNLGPMVVCPPPRAKRGRAGPDCGAEWNDRQRDAGALAWRYLDDSDRWALFRQARGDDW